MLSAKAPLAHSKNEGHTLGQKYEFMQTEMTTSTPSSTQSTPDDSSAPLKHLRIFPHSGEVVSRAKGLAKLAYFLVPRHALRPFVKEAKLIPLKLRNRNMARNYRNAHDLLINIGVGASGHEGWVNVDCYPNKGVNCVFDARKKLPFPTNSARAIFTEHFFEHIDYTEETPYFLTECRRVLQPGGVLRIIVPDTEKFLHSYANDADGGWENMAKMRNLNSQRREEWSDTEYNTRMEVINAVFRSGFSHKYAYDYETLEFLLLKYGFKTVLRQEYGRTLLPVLNIDQAVREAESLYVEAVK